jgi:hypothetical protein
LAQAPAILQAAWRTAGTTESSWDLSDMARRSRVSGLVPELHLRAMRVQDTTARVDTRSDTAKASGTVGEDLWLEARLSFRLDRLVYADEETGLHRLRLEVLQGKRLVTQRVIELLQKVLRAQADAEASVDGSPEGRDAQEQLTEHGLALDLLTDGFYSATVGRPQRCTEISP